MASPQLGNTPGLDLPFHNFGASDIATNLAVLLDTSNVQSGDYVGGVVLPTSAGGNANTIGVTVERIPAGQTGRVRVYGVSQCTADGSITAGNMVSASDTSGKLGRVKVCPTGTTQLGVALSTATDAQLVSVLHSLARNA